MKATVEPFIDLVTTIRHAAQGALAWFIIRSNLYFIAQVYCALNKIGGKNLLASNNIVDYTLETMKASNQVEKVLETIQKPLRK